MDRFDWEKTKEGTIRLLGVKEIPSEVIVPDEIEGLPVTEVGPYCFARNKYLERVVLPDSVTTLSRMVFYHCTSLKELEIRAKNYYKQTPMDKVNEIVNSINMISSIMDVLK